MKYEHTWQIFSKFWYFRKNSKFLILWHFSFLALWHLTILGPLPWTHFCSILKCDSSFPILWIFLTSSIRDILQRAPLCPRLSTPDYKGRQKRLLPSHVLTAWLMKITTLCTKLFQRNYFGLSPLVPIISRRCASFHKINTVFSYKVVKMGFIFSIQIDGNEFESVSNFEWKSMIFGK